MRTPKAKRTTKARSQGPTARPASKYVLRLFVAGATARSLQVVVLVRKLCAAGLEGGCQLEVIDIYQQPRLARANQIVATPTLLVEFPRPVRRFIGSLANITGLSVKLGLERTGKVTL